MTQNELLSYKEKAFDSFCKSVIKNESADAFRELALRKNHVIEFSALSESELSAFYVEDKYYVYRKKYYVAGYIIEVHDPVLGDRMQFLLPKFRNVILLSYFLGFSDTEIAKMLHINSSTVHYRKNIALRRLKTILEANNYDQIY